MTRCKFVAQVLNNKEFNRDHVLGHSYDFIQCTNEEDHAGDHLIVVSNEVI